MLSFVDDILNCPSLIGNDSQWHHMSSSGRYHIPTKLASRWSFDTSA
ncbi:hypothetical protein BVRB_012560 [Beta vulgaris subsp. vulgaris]|uniref:Uncharacterized protein n=1 Tax=Beta vulgaris subsp. vulgaris TaxID=3555 RepID=A0A0J8DW84_BETVV|nr:hypothetical protein BVRB_012560 [Beta vulgaris subsp. vulgaris]